MGLYKYMKFKKQLDKEDDGSSSSKKSGEGSESKATTGGEDGASKRPKARLDKQFFKRLKLLLSIVVPSLKYVFFVFVGLLCFETKNCCVF